MITNHEQMKARMMNPNTTPKTGAVERKPYKPYDHMAKYTTLDQLHDAKRGNRHIITLWDVLKRAHALGQESMSPKPAAVGGPDRAWRTLSGKRGENILTPEGEEWCHLSSSDAKWLVNRLNDRERSLRLPTPQPSHDAESVAREIVDPPLCKGVPDDDSEAEADYEREVDRVAAIVQRALEAAAAGTEMREALKTCAKALETASPYIGYLAHGHQRAREVVLEALLTAGRALGRM